jgi:DNA-binding NarL/FixJ family response regulator
MTNHPKYWGPCEDCLQFAEEYDYDLSRLSGPKTTPKAAKKRRKESRAETARRLRAEGLVVGAIADRMGVSEKTVRNYLADSLTP